MAKIDELIINLFKYLDSFEISESGRPFHPNQITSCRSTDYYAIDKILNELREEIRNRTRHNQD